MTCQYEHQDLVCKNYVNELKNLSEDNCQVNLLCNTYFRVVTSSGSKVIIYSLVGYDLSWYRNSYLLNQTCNGFMKFGVVFIPHRSTIDVRSV